MIRWSHAPSMLLLGTLLCAASPFVARADEEDGAGVQPSEPAAVEPTAEKKPADESAEEKPAVEKPADEKPADEKPAVEKPADEKPADEKPAAEEPADTETPTEPREVEAVAPDSAAPPPVKLPKKTPDGRPFRPIGLFQSQLVELVPTHYVPMSLERLNRAESVVEQQAPPPHAAQIRNARYVVRLQDDTLVSDRSTIDIRYDGDAVMRQSLGKVNLAIDPLPTRSIVLNDSLPRLESHPDGTLSAMVESDAVVSFVWSLRGKHRGLVREFDLQIPRAPQTRIELATPLGVAVETLDGVIAPMSEPPADAPTTAGSVTESQWWQIDAGGLETVRLRIRTVDESMERDTIIVRRTSMQYEIEPRGVNWTCRMAVQLPGRGDYPPLMVHGGTILSVSLDSVDVPLTTLVRRPQAQVVQFADPATAPPRSGTLATISVAGFSSWDETSGWCDLPMPTWVAPRVIQTSATSQVQLQVGEPLELVTWELPATWSRTFGDPAAASSVMVQAEGPPLPPLAVPTEDVDGGTSHLEAMAAAKTPAWSRVRLAMGAALRTSDSTVAFVVGDGSLDARARITVAMDPDRLQPLRFRLQRGWNLLSMTLPISGRVIETPSVDSRTNTVVVWPEPGDVIDGRIVIEANGRNRLATEERGFTIPASWFIRVDDVRGVMTVAMIPPPTMKWSGETTMRLTRLSADSLSPDQRAYLGSLPPEALLFRPDLLRTPVLSVQAPSVSFNVTSELRLRREGDEWVESLELETDSSGPMLATLNVVTGPAEGRPPLRWLLRSSTDSTPVSLPPASVTFSENDPTGTYAIDLSNRDMRGKALIGRRRYVATKPLKIELPRIPEAASQNAEVLLDEGFEIQQRSTSVHRVPIPIPSAADEPSLDDSEVVLPETEAAEVAFRDRPSQTRLRYDPVDQPSIVVAPSASTANVNLVWQKRVRVIGSSRGTDEVEAVLSVSATDPVTVTFAPELRLTSVRRDSELTEDYESTPGSVTLAPRGGTESIRLRWTRHQAMRGWWRSCRIPHIEVSGVVVHGQTQLIAAADSFLPAAIWSGRGAGVESVAPESKRMLVHHDVVLATGWLLAILTFALSWWVARRSVALVAAFVTLVVTMAILWAPWSLALIGWVLVPASAAALLATSIEYRHWLQEITSGDPDSRSTRSRLTSLEPPEEEMPSKPLASSGAFWWLVATLAIWSASRTLGQDALTPTTPHAADAPVTMLVPIDEDGHLVGDKVYVPESVYANLFQPQQPGAPEEARFQFADYRLNVEPTREPATPAPPILSAEYVVRVDQPSTTVVLPLRSESVRRIELVGSDNDRIVRFTERDEDSIEVTVPPAPLFRLRVTLVPTMTVTAQGTQISLRVPRIASARLTVDLDRGVDAVAVESAMGRIISDPDLRRTVADLGPVDRIVLRYIASDRSQPVVGQSLTRRYWIHCGQQQTAVDCEITPSVPLTNGETMELVIQHSSVPTLVSPAWQIVGNELLSPTRRKLTLANLSETRSPIRLLWTLPSQINDPGSDELISLEIPEVGLPSASVSAPVWVGLHSDPGLRVAPSNRTVVEPLAVDQFLAQWSGYRDRIDRAFVAIDQLPPIVLLRTVRPQATVIAQHHLQVTSNELQLRYRATITGASGEEVSRTLRVPPGLELLSLTVDGSRLDADLLDGPGTREVLLGTISGPNPTVIQAVAVAPRLTNGRFTPPRMELWPPIAIRDTYTMSRDSKTNVETITPSKLPDVDAAARQLAPRSEIAAPADVPPVLARASDAELLAAGWIPISTWQIDQTLAEQLPSDPSRPQATPPAARAESPLPGGEFKTSARQEAFNVHQLIALSWNEGRWSMETRLRMDPGGLPDFVDVEIPTRWCESLEVSPTSTWTRQPSTDPALQVIRIACDRVSSEDPLITIRSHLKSADKARLNVPSVAVLGNGQRTALVSVPHRLTNERIHWRTSAVSAVSLSDEMSEENAAPSSHSLYEVAGPAWSIELASLPRASASASITGRDTQVYQSGSSALVLVRWDLIPAGLTSVDVAIPHHAVPVGAWSAGRAVNAEPISSEGSNAGKIFRVPLALDRLSQPIEILFRIPGQGIARRDYDAHILNVDQPSGWIGLYALGDGDDRSHASVSFDETSLEADPSTHALALATSAVECLERSFDNLAERPTNEIVAWLVPWVDRYEALSAAAGRQSDVASLLGSLAEKAATAESEEGGDRSASSADDDAGRASRSDEATLNERWNALDERIGTLIERFATSGDLADFARRDAPPRFGVTGFEGYERIALAHLPVNQTAPVIYSSSTTRLLREWIANALTLLLVAALLVLAWRYRQHAYPLIHHPAAWLAVLGVCGMYVAPIPVAAALLLVAIVLPWFHRPVPRT